ncbi:MAG: ABC transporter permease [Proteobacteria bacterium]|nr:ABC transporter permease [Pseudomonadota bacterium]
MRRIFRHLARALADIRENLLLHALAASTIGIIFLLSGTFSLAIVNLSALMDRWHGNARIMVYLDDSGPGRLLEGNLVSLPGVKSVTFISKAEALKALSGNLGPQAGLLANLDENPLPAAFELSVDLADQGPEAVARAAEAAGALAGVSDVEYGRQWLSRFTMFIRLARVAALALSVLFLVAAVFITASTIRLVLYNRAEEISIMRLVGATEGFIRAPFYLQGMIQGLAGGLFALAVLFSFFALARSGISGGLTLGGFTPLFLPVWAWASGLAAAGGVGLGGCFLTFIRFGGR